MEAIVDLWTDYRWPTKVVVGLLILSCVGGAVLEGWPSLTRHVPGIALMGVSGAFQTLLTLAAALFIAVNFYRRARGGVLDGDEHYNVARALSFGYFKNFLVPALQLADRQTVPLQVFQPRSMDDLRAYSSSIEPTLRERFEHGWLPLVEAPLPGGPPRRTVLSIQRPSTSVGVGEPVEPFFFDAPTALFTVQDFYGALNRRRTDQGKEPLSAGTVLRYQEKQIASFFRHLDFLFTTEAGFEAVRDIVPSLYDLSLLQQHLRFVSMEDLESRYPSTSPGGA